jgi:hypothetical protein
MTIPASNIVSVNPSVLSAGGNPLALNGLILSESTELPVGPPISFPSASSVSSYFGASSLEAQMATTYFGGYVGATQMPGALLFYRYANVALGAFLRGATNTATLTAIQAITAGSLSVTIDGVLKTSSAINLSAASSFANAASLIGSALTLSGGQTCTYDTTQNAFVISSGTTGVTSTITEATGTVATLLNLTSALGAVLSQGADATTPSAAMSSIIAVTQNWASFSSAFQPDLAGKEAFALWTSQQNGRYLYVPYDTDATAAQTPASYTGLGNYLSTNNLSGTAPMWQDPLLSAFVMGAIASIDFNRQNARITLAFKSSASAITQVTDLTTAENLKANGFSFYGAYATANQQFTYLYNGQVSGSYKFIDSYVNSIWFTNQCQLALMSLVTSVGSIPYNADGYGLIKAALQDPVNQALNFGAMRAGVVLSASQIAQVNAAAGVKIDDTLANRGWYLQVKDPGPQARQNRTTPICSIWYMDGESVQQITLASIDIL